MLTYTIGNKAVSEAKMNDYRVSRITHDVLLLPVVKSSEERIKMLPTWNDGQMQKEKI